MTIKEYLLEKYGADFDIWYSLASIVFIDWCSGIDLSKSDRKAYK